MTDIAPPPTYPHDPDAVLDYKWKWASWLPAGDTIASVDVTKAEGDTVEIDDVEHDGTEVVAWVSGGTADTFVQLTARITTTQGRVDDRTMQLYVQHR
ncbi:MAG TPA: hypothetical protein VK611_25150 [Acidimicrobiales bacterium]|nr:hypothetical protein [Acidimicrobiales bacterium]